MTEALEEVPDAELIAAVRAGDGSAFGVLYERHLVAAKRAAVSLANSPAEREDLVAEAFTRVLRMLREGRGPDADFRPYLLVTLRNTAIHATTRAAPVSLYADVPETAPAGGADDPVLDRWHASVAADAFASLPERWRFVLWHTEVENESPAAVAPLLGMRPNSVAALAYRAREGLRQAYLRMQVTEPPREQCRATAGKLAGYVRHSIPLPLSRKIGKHLTACADCSARADALRRVNEELRGLAGLVVLGAPLVAACLPVAATGTALSGAVSGTAGAVPGVVSGAVSGAVSGVASGAVSGVASGAASGAVPGALLAMASDAASTTVSGLLAAKAAVVQVAAALAVAAAAATVGSAAAPVHDVVAATGAALDVRPPVIEHAAAAPGGAPARERALTPDRAPSLDPAPTAKLESKPDPASASSSGRSATSPTTGKQNAGTRQHGKSAQQYGNPHASAAETTPAAAVSQDEPGSAKSAKPAKKPKKPKKN